MPITPSSAPVGVIKTVQFSVLTAEQIRAMSVCEVNTTEMSDHGIPKRNSLHDPRMGPLERGQKCLTCSASTEECPGHFGHIELAKPMFHVGFFSTVLSVLRCVCFTCSRILCSKDDPKFKKAQTYKKPQARLRAMTQLCSPIKECKLKKDDSKPQESGNIFEDDEHVHMMHDGCGQPQPRFTRTQLKLIIEFDERSELPEGEERKRELDSETVYNILRNISDEDCRALGFNPKYARPDSLMLTVLPVPPPCVRPSILVDSTRRAEDDLTFSLMQIVRVNNDVRRLVAAGTPPSGVEPYLRLLQYYLATYFDNTLPSVPANTQKSGKPLKSITQRLKGKEGRIRGNLMGKRTDFSGRTVITGDPTISVDEVGVPMSIAKTLTFPEVVTPFNIRRLTKLVMNGAETHPGARFIIRSDGRRLELSDDSPASRHLEVGYIVERHMDDGDFVIFNRQPSLHKMSMMGHRVKILPYSSFRLNLSCTTPYNADFDGDEMNLHLPQSIEARTEVRELMMLPRQIVSPQANKNCIGVVQDSLLAAYLFTSRDTFLERDLVMNLLMWLTHFDGKVPKPAIVKPKPLWTGKQIMSLCMPPVTIYKLAGGHPDNETTTMSPGDTRVIIENGKLLTGMLESKTLKQSEGSIVHVIWKDFGHEAAMHFLNQIQRVTNYWMVNHGFTVGIGDTIANEKTVGEVANIIQKAKEKVQEFVTMMMKKELELRPGRTQIETFEVEVNKVLNEASSEAGKVAQKALPASNNIKLMVAAGSKGSTLNISQIAACVGQQNVEGKRIRYGFRKRTLPHFTQDDPGTESKGFVENSYLKGLTPQEFYFHAMGGREGVIDTAVKTSETGYIQRRLIKAMEDLTVCYDSTVRNSVGQIIQFLYGEDGLAGEQVESQQFDTLQMSDQAFRNKYRFDLGIDEASVGAGAALAGHDGAGGLGMMDSDYLLDGAQGTAAADVVGESAALFHDDTKMDIDNLSLSSSSSSTTSSFSSGLDTSVAISAGATGGGEHRNVHRRILPIVQKDKERGKKKTTLAQLETFLTEDAVSKLLNDPFSQRILTAEFEQLSRDRDQLRNAIFASGTDKWPQPVNIARLIHRAKLKFQISPLRPTSLTPTEAAKMVEKAISRFVIIRGDDEISKSASENATLLFNILVRSSLASRVVTEVHRLSRQALSWILEEIEYKFKKAQVQPAEMVGVIAAQSIGEPATQMTLNTFHYAGVSSKNVTLGVPRLRELINVTKKTKTPGLLVYLGEEERRTAENAKVVQSYLEYTTLRHVTELSEIYYDPDEDHSIIERDQTFVQIFQEQEFDQEHLARLTPWLLRFTLVNSIMTEKHMKMEEIRGAINDAYGDDLQCIPTDDNAEELVLRIRAKMDEEEAAAMDQSGDPDHAKQLNELAAGVGYRATGGAATRYDNSFFETLEAAMLSDLALRGVPDIKKVFIREVQCPKFNKDGSFNSKATEWILDTEGCNLSEVMAQPHVDPYRCTSNNIVEIFQVLGIEAVRAALLKEVRDVISFDTSYVNYRHLSMLVDLMTTHGILTSITRHGLGAMDTGPLMRATYEESTKILLSAAAFSENDKLRGVSQCVMLGKPAPCGTGYIDIAVDTNKLKNVIVIPEALQEMAVKKAQAEALNEIEGAGLSGASGFGDGAMKEGDGRGVMGGWMDPMGGMTPMYNPGLSPMIGSSPSGGMTPFIKTDYDQKGGGYGYSGPSFSPTHMAEFGMDVKPNISQSGGYDGRVKQERRDGASGLYSSTYQSAMSPLTSPMAFSSPVYSPSAMSYSMSSPRYSPAGISEGADRRNVSSPLYSPSSPAFDAGSSITYASGARGARTSPLYSPTSPTYSTTSATYTPTSPAYSPSSPAYSPSSPAYSPSSPAYSPSSPAYSPSSPAYSPSSPAYSPSSPAYSPSSPAYSPSSPAYSPSSPAYSPSSPAYSPSSPAYSPSSPAYSPSSPAYSPSSPAYSPSSPAYSPSSPAYSPSSPAYSPSSPAQYH
ncbi:putative DNA-directed RNA polymerase large subunit [Monocercomonoides exilis]|uniref:putative DNA-directed RNA polymerase large subunit n=1 Tax=Monocercomonoides exilis TaxID=2049356 RepID=UPI003559F015|nr:putative DNA-directed RNA polymerase large subunit [Monocercomonoides exilis]|eukprot:MONOS_7157.1-p1 / transcript=MONOS_7157.1 / gene=MONOS_7157 / organism=Monocercomonoides_exilis_PA203 / gene_product=DNA-directed RNA polymerase large subunit [EC:2.7.7.6] / transcript_product=DNA-directed RNA polymerase large subunit [EC:2.7.7.6] / location=Mono_scaffold00238:53049-59463(+) / protein_length=1983 / sequence_SO=supercontig / SO=protein_coding / is_pseudo=false